MGTMMSLRKKIIFGYLVVGLFVVTLSLVTVYEMLLLERGLSTEESLSNLVDAVMEIRRFEKNYFLYRENSDLTQNGTYIAAARDILEKNSGILPVVAGPGAPAKLQGLLENYRVVFSDYATSPSTEREARVRAAGRELTDNAYELAAWRRTDLHRAMRTNRYTLIGVVAGGIVLILVSGTLVSLGVTRPLRQLQERMEEIASGARFERLDLPAKDAELQSLAEAFNLVLGELNLRSRQMLVSEKLASLGVMLSGVAHELNNPISNISTSCQILIEEGEQVPPDFLKEHLVQIDEQTERARRIVASLLDFSRNQKFLKEYLSLAALVEESLAFVRRQMPSGAAIVIDIPPELSVPADRHRLQQVLVNLLKNAADACGPSGHVHLSATVHGDMAHIAVRDDGCGIAEADLAHIFDPFYTTKAVGKGSGLGLFIVHDIVNKHGGTVGVTSAPGKGTEFLIRLPIGADTSFRSGGPATALG